VAGTATVSVSVALPGITFTGGTISLAMNTTTAAALGLPAGPFMRVSGTDVSLNLLGQSISGSFTFEQATDGTGAKVVKIGISNGAISLGGSIVNITNIHGLVVITGTGLGASLSASVSIGISGLSIAGALELDFNTTTAAMHESVDVGGASVSTCRPAPTCGSPAPASSSTSVARRSAATSRSNVTPPAQRRSCGWLPPTSAWRSVTARTLC
jgi:hypothetical protein